MVNVPNRIRKRSFSGHQLAIFILAFGLIGYIIFRTFAASNPNLPGDLNNDNTVNGADLSLILSNYGTSNSAGDVNGDGTVNSLDLSILLSHFGQTYTAQSCPAPNATNITACYYNGTSFNQLVKVQNDPTIDFTWADGQSPAPGVNTTNYSVSWSKINNFNAGNYTFSMTVDDGGRLYIDNNLVMDHWVDEFPTTYTSVQSLTAGNHTIKMEYYNSLGGGRALLSWTAGGTTGGGTGGGAGVIKTLDFSSGTWLIAQNPPGAWDTQEVAGNTGIQIIGSSIPGFTNAGKFWMAPGTSSNKSLHTRALVRENYGSVSYAGSEFWASGAFILPSGGNSNNQYNGSMLMELFHNENSVIDSSIAPIGIFVHEPVNGDYWNGSSWGNPSNLTTPSIVLRVTGGYVPNQQPSGNHPATAAAFYHANVGIPGMQPVPMSTPVWFIIHYIGHEYANGNPPGGYNAHTSPNFNGADTAPGTLEIWMVASSSRPTAAMFGGAPLLSFSPSKGTGIPTLVYGDDGSGNVVHDKPYGPLAGSYDSADTIGYNSEVDWAGVWINSSFSSAVSTLTGQ